MNQSPFNPDPQSTTDDERLARSSRSMIAVLTIVALFSAVTAGYVGYTNDLPQLYILSAIFAASAIAQILPFFLITRGRVESAVLLAIGIFFINILATPFFVQGMGFILMILTILAAVAAANLAMLPRYLAAGMISGIILGIVVLGLDALLETNRMRIPNLETYAPYIAALFGLPVLVLLGNRFNQYSLQVKISLGILLTGGIIVASLLAFGFNRITAIIGSLSQKFEETAAERVEAEIMGGIQTEAGNVDATLATLQADLIHIAEYRSEVGRQSKLFFDGDYWNASEKIIQLSGGQYGNSAEDQASIYIPSNHAVVNTMLNDINTTASLDFVIPSFMASHPEVAAVYYTSHFGYITYYPNNNLAANLPANFDPILQPAYLNASPTNNPTRAALWTEPYQDPAGAGLIVTLSAPVHTSSGSFLGVVNADIQVSSLSEMIPNTLLGKSRLSFLVDKRGHVLSMPEQGYIIFSLPHEEIQLNQTSTITISDNGSDELRAIAPNVLSGTANLIIAPINGIDSYVAIAPLQTTGYSLVIVAPADEVNREISLVRENVQAEVQSSLRSASVILLVLFIGALLVSLWVGRVITRPMNHLATTVEQITRGDITARVEVSSQDETGLLAQSFNIMADRLKENLATLEERVAERTKELEKTIESNAYRATQFESIAQIARTISSTQSLDTLLPQITETISERLGFYHVGIFLLDAQKQYAVLVAANSPGGKVMLARDHRLRVGETGIVGNVTRTGQARLALDVGQDAVFFESVDLPETRSEIALPLRIGAEIIGALDVQSTKAQAFSQEDVNILSTLAEQVSIAIQNARSYQESQEALAQAGIISAQLSEQQWRRFLTRQTIGGYHFDGVEARQLKSSSEAGLNHSLSIPLTLRGTRIGTLKLNAPDPNRVWTEEEIALAQATADRTALAIENARLLEDAQKRAAKERTIGEISAKIGNLVNLENIVQTTIQELGNTLPGTEIAIQFTPQKPGQ